MSELNPFLLAANTPSPDPRLLPLLRSDPSLAARQDAHGYSLLHAASSYNHVNLLKSLVSEFSVDINLEDEDGETCLFVVETLEAAKCLVEDLKIDTSINNHEGMTAAEKFESEDEYPEIATYLRQQAGQQPTASPSSNTRLPTLPPNVSIGVNTTEEQTATLEQEPDPEFRRRIEELAARDNFQSEEGQRELRELITDAVRGVSDERDVRRRVV
ncbi:uncharacterized protein HMPREF1541_08748 [Cyphellophora europaea CBS 101466]|uniref:Uncharacterized protein n=1 Tax=Cyphellophora europaea (strain CBS 101466) TaxID=1220924 RepID=W2RJG4_CYPE1|nr:uncharacterized protein HMPREF1541_08748 [Cyphellophora europaea CBS 101466]ETN36470.1 hypothetical protein HMPREF1541_08748 [Cyphellophora europaea CBS 101466]